MKITIELDDEYTAKNMMNWYEYYSSCKEIEKHIRGQLKHGNISDESAKVFASIRALLPAYYPGED